MKAEDRIVVVIDTPEIDVAIDRINMMLPFTNIFKLGHIPYSSPHFWTIAEYIKKHNKFVFLDLKLWDIPKTVYETLKSLDKNDVVGYVTVKWDALDKEQVEEFSGPGCITPIAVVHLSSNRSFGKYAWEDFEAAGYNGFSDVIVSPSCMDFGLTDIIKWVPGIRLAEQDKSDHVITFEPQQAIHYGADKIILGSALFNASDPSYQASKIWQMVNRHCKDAA